MPDVIAQVTLKNGGEYFPPGSVVTIDDEDEAQDLVDRGFAEWAGDDSEESDEEAPLSEVNVSDLAEALAGVDDLEAIRAAQEADDRKSAKAHYEARIAELEEAGDDSEESDEG